MDSVGRREEALVWALKSRPKGNLPGEKPRPLWGGLPFCFDCVCASTKVVRRKTTKDDAQNLEQTRAS
jgi:hypothetical protein